LFGYKKGAFTGASSSHKGLVEAAQGGTLFLDEVGEISPALQVKLLRLVQEKTIKMIGDTEDVSVDVRIISATHRDLEQMVIDGTFREDLYYRLNVLPVKLPALRERRDDIPVLADNFLAKFSTTFGKDIRKISSYAMDILKNYDFPGNVRELENIIERGVALESSSIILPDSLTLATYKKIRQAPSPSLPSLPPEGMNLDQYLAEIEIRMLQESLQQAKGVRLRAAEILGISFRSFRYRLLKYGLATEDE
jgi:two-component system response regulator PilR (NtrC family)